MAALTEDKARDERDVVNKKTATVAIRTSATVYVGSLAAYDTGGRVRVADNAANLRPAGIIEKIVNDTNAVITAGTGNTAGTIKAVVAWGHEVKIDVLTAARTFVNLGKNVFASSDNEVTDTTGAGTAGVRVKMGSLTEFTDLTNKDEAWLALRVYGDADAT